MASLLLKNGLVVPRVSSRSAARPVFGGARRVVAARAAAPEAVTQENLWDVDVGNILGEIGTSARTSEDIEELTEADLAIIEEAMSAEDEYDVPMDVAAAIEAAEGEDAEDVASATSLAEALSIKKLWTGENWSASDVAEVESLLDSDLEMIEEIEDYLPADRGERYVDPPLTPQEKAAVSSFKLTKSELRNLVPKDWDQINIDFFTDKREDIPLPEFRLNVLWTRQNVAISLDQVYSRAQVSPLSDYFFWPRVDAWEELKQSLESRPWISERDKIILLNRLTMIINFWQDDNMSHTVEEARVEFPDCVFMSG